MRMPGGSQTQTDGDDEEGPAAEGGVAEAGHGEYTEIPEEKEFFQHSKNSTNVVLPLFRDETFRCKILDKHLGRSWPRSTWRPSSSR